MEVRFQFRAQLQGLSAPKRARLENEADPYRWAYQRPTIGKRTARFPIVEPLSVPSGYDFIGRDQRLSGTHCRDWEQGDSSTDGRGSEIRGGLTKSPPIPAGAVRVGPDSRQALQPSSRRKVNERLGITAAASGNSPRVSDFVDRGQAHRPRSL